MARKITRQFIKDRAEYRAQCAEENLPCWICGMGHIDYEAPFDDYANDDRFELQHDPSNFRPSAAGCNRTRGNGPPRPGLGILSRAWT